MKDIVSALRPALIATLVLAGVTCGAYPLLVTGVAQFVFPAKAHGSLIAGPHGTVCGSSQIGQHFGSDRYFQPRPSAAGNGYDAASSGGSNLGPASRKLRDQVAERIARYRTANGLAGTEQVPADAVTASGSGLDPHISPRNAAWQAHRVAKLRNLSLEKVRERIEENTEGPDLGVLGKPGVNVLKLNLSLDALQYPPVTP